MKHRKTLGFAADAAETAAVTMADPYATSRIFDACDFEHDEKMRKRKIEAFLSKLSSDDRKFSEAVLSGGTWKSMGMPKRTFNWRLSKICIAHHPPFAHCM